MDRSLATDEGKPRASVAAAEAAVAASAPVDGAAPRLPRPDISSGAPIIGTYIAIIGAIIAIEVPMEAPMLFMPPAAGAAAIPSSAGCVASSSGRAVPSWAGLPAPSPAEFAAGECAALSPIGPSVPASPGCAPPGSACCTAPVRLAPGADCVETCPF